MKENTVFDKNRFIEAVLTSNKEIYNYIKNDLIKDDYLYTNTIGFGGDNSLNIDIKLEKIFRKHLEEFGNIYSEECGFIDNQSKYTIVIDPLDGSNNFLAQIPYYGTSVALKFEDKTVAGFVTNLITGKLTYKIFDEEIQYYNLASNKYLKKQVEVSNSNLAIFERAYKFANICNSFYEKKLKFRSLGASALSLCDASNYDFVFFAGDIREFDIAASLYINKDLFTFWNEEFVLISKNKEKFSQVLEILKEI